MSNAAPVRYATVKEVAATMRHHEKTIRRWAIAGRIAATRTPTGYAILIEVDEQGKPLPVAQPEGEE